MMSVNILWLYILYGICGMFFQILLNRKSSLIYPLSIIMGLVSGALQNYYILSFNIGMISKEVLGKYWSTVVIQSICMFNGFLIGFYLM